jgi:hypothetical protein
MVPRLVFGMICGCGNKVLGEACPDLFGVTCVKDASVEVHLELFGSSN